jgi:hypothetical protein
VPAQKQGARSKTGLPATASKSVTSWSHPSTRSSRVLRHGGFSSRDDLIDRPDTYVINRWTYDGAPLKAA